MRSERTAVYRCYGASDELLYIGATGNLEVRFKAHAKKRPEWPQVKRTEVVWYETQAEALAAESSAIAAELPAWNRRDIPGWRPTPTRRRSTKWLSTTEAAEILHCSKSTIIKIVDNGILPAGRVGNRRRILRTVAEAYRDKMAAEAAGE